MTKIDDNQLSNVTGGLSDGAKCALTVAAAATVTAPIGEAAGSILGPVGSIVFGAAGALGSGYAAYKNTPACRTD